VAVKNKTVGAAAAGALAVLTMFGPALYLSSGQAAASSPVAHTAHGGGHDHSVKYDGGGEIEKDFEAQAELDVLATDCSQSALPPHDGFQDAPACSSAVFGEISDLDKNPQLLIVDSPKKIYEGEDFTLKVSTRNLVRDRFLGAAAGGYYLETSLLNEDGLQRGHFHTACRVLASDDEAPAPSNKPEFFQATEDGGGGAEPDTVEIKVPGKNDDGSARFTDGQLVQCTAWAGDGSHRIPMMEFAAETPAIDSVRLKVD
jgi:hypothetical protein